MELDDFKKKHWKDSNFFPGNGSREERINNLIDQFKSVQKTQRRKSIIWAGILITLALIYLSLQGNQTGLTNLGLVMIGTGFILGSVYFYFRYKPLTPISYSLPMVEFLSLAEKKLNYFNLTDWFVTVPLLLILGTGGGFIFVESLLKYTNHLTLLTIIWILFFLLLSLFGFLAGKKNWDKAYGGLVKKLIEMKRNYQSDEKNDKSANTLK